MDDYINQILRIVSESTPYLPLFVSFQKIRVTYVDDNMNI